jgi:hypothetical protein
MRSLKDIKESIRHAGIGAKPQADQEVLRHLLTEWETVTGGASARSKQRDARAVARRRIVKVVAAAALVVLALIVAARLPQRTPPRLEGRAESAADLLTVGRLNAACRRGGLEAMNRQCEEAARRLNTGAERVSVQELMREFQETSTSKG